MTLIDRLFEVIDAKSSPILVGLDPLVDRLPPHLSEKTRGLQATTAALLEFNLELIEAIADTCAAVKLQMACYEAYGAEGYRVFEATAKAARDKGLVVIDDSKRGDIGSTAKLYALGHIGRPPLLGAEAPEPVAHFVTVNPYLGDDGLKPFYEIAAKEDRGVFVLVRTSNPSAGQYQAALIEGRPLYERIAQDLQTQAKPLAGQRGYAPLGAVVGATWPEEAARLRALMPNVPFLVPGYGAQGGTGDDVMPSFDAQGYGALVNSSRGIIFAWEKYGLEPKDFAKAARRAALEMRDDLIGALTRAGKRPKGW